MIRIGDTFFGSVFGRDPDGHLWVVISEPTPEGWIAVVNVTTHRPGRLWHDESCVLVRPGDHPFLVRESCIAYLYADLTTVAALERKLGHELDPREPVPQRQLQRIQDGALASPDVAPNIKSAVRASRAENL